MADKYGRKAVIFPSLTLLLVGGLISPFFTNIWVFLCARFVTGFASPIGIQMFILMLEYVDTRHRALAGKGNGIFSILNILQKLGVKG